MINLRAFNKSASPGQGKAQIRTEHTAMQPSRPHKTWTKDTHLVVAGKYSITGRGM